MNQSPPPSDNLFLRSYATWRAKSMKLTGRMVLLAVIPLAAIMLLLAVAKVQLNTDIATHADQVGAEMARQIAASVADPLAADDQLSLNIQLAQWKRSPLISHIRLYTAENRLIAEAGDEPGRGRLAPGQGDFNATVHFQDAMVGQVTLSLAAEPFTGPANTLLWRLFWTALLLALVAALVAWRLADGMRQTLRGLGSWYGDSAEPAPGLGRRDELGELARQLSGRRIVDLPPDPEPEPEPEIEPESQAGSTRDEPTTAIADKPQMEQDAEQAEPAEGTTTATPETDPIGPDALVAEQNERPQGVSADAPRDTDGASVAAADGEIAESDASEAAPAAAPAPAETAMLAVRLGNQEALRRLARPRLMNLLERYRAQLQQACELYNGHLHTLQDGTSLVAFHARECRQDELTHALCCGELLRVLGHELQVEIADTGITLHLQLAIGHVADLRFLEEAALATHQDCLLLLEAVQHSRNLLLLDAALATSDDLKDRAVVRRLASQPGIYCVERLHGPYQAMLERQLTHFYHQRPD